MLEARNVEVRLGRGGQAHLLKGVSASLRFGEVLVIAGMNGAGKSTLLRTLAGELAPSAGSVTWKGESLNQFGFQTLARDRAYLSQQTICSLPFRVEQVVLLGAEAVGISGAEADALAHKCMEMTGTASLADRIIDTLSGGEQQRVHWARVLAQLGGNYEGKCLMLDEPVSSLDISHQHEMLALARKVAKAGAAVVTVLHDLNLAAQYADRFLLLREGRVAGEGTAAEVLTPEMIYEVFEVRVRIANIPDSPRPWIFVEDSESP